MQEPFTASSFGAMVPDNWQEITDYLNAYYQETGEDPAEIWEKYCSRLLTGAPPTKDQ